MWTVNWKLVGSVYGLFVMVGMLINGLIYFDVPTPDMKVEVGLGRWQSRQVVLELDAWTGSTECDKYTDCGNGLCTYNQVYNTTKCVCDSRYIDHDGGTCSYQQKSKLATFLISFFAGTLGADWFYLARGSAAYNAAGSFKLLTVGGLLIWSTVDWIRVLADDFPDGNGVALTSTMS